MWRCSQVHLRLPACKLYEIRKYALSSRYSGHVLSRESGHVFDMLLTLGSLQNQMDGMTGNIQIYSAGRRSHFKLDIVEYSKGYKTVGWWQTERGVKRTQTAQEKEQEIQKSIQDKTFIVASRIVSHVITSFLTLVRESRNYVTLNTRT